MTSGDGTPAAAVPSIIGVVGCGVTGGRVAAGLHRFGHRVAVFDVLHGNAVAVSRQSPGVVVVDAVEDLTVCDLVVLCQPAGHAELAAQFLRDSTAVVSISDDLADLSALLSLTDLAHRHEVPLVVGAGMAPGLSGLLARYLGDQMQQLDELHVAIHGTAGPACARQHHHALASDSQAWHDGRWIEMPGGSGRDLVWFPEPVEAHDCYRAALGDPLLLHEAFPEVVRISARVSATRRDRMTARLPMLTPPHASGDLGAVRVEARGADADGGRVTLIAGAAAPTADLAAATAAATASRLAKVGVEPGVHLLGSATLAPLLLLHHTTLLGVRVQEFTGVPRPTAW
jgi:hypothetical protein